MLRERADKLPVVTEEMWHEINEENRELVDEYFLSSPQLSADTMTQYKSSFHQFFWWIRMTCKNIPMYEIKKRDFIKYRSYLINHGLASSSLSLKKSSVSSLCNYIENDYSEVNEKYTSFINFTR
jgi:site-specific recombinase XerD